MSMKEIGTKPSDESLKVRCRLRLSGHGGRTQHRPVEVQFLQAVLNLHWVEARLNRASSVALHQIFEKAAVRRIIVGEKTPMLSRGPRTML